MRLREWKCCFRIDSIEIQRNFVQAKVVVYTVKKWSHSNVIYIMLNLHQNTVWMDILLQFITYVMLNLHKNQVWIDIMHQHEGKKPFKCEICDAHCSSSWRKKPFKCETCDATFARKNKFTRKDNLNIHIATVHEEMKPFKCDICKAEFRHKVNLNTHIAKVHEKMKPFKCDTCEAKFTQKSKLNTHVATVHEEMKPYVIYVMLNLQQNKIWTKILLQFMNEIRLWCLL